MDKHFEQSRNLCLALNEAWVIIRNTLPGDRPAWIDDEELHHSLAIAAQDAVPGLRLGVIEDQAGNRLVLPVLGQHWICHRGVRSQEQLVQSLTEDHPDRGFVLSEAPAHLYRANPALVRIAAEAMEGFALDTSIGNQSIFRFN